MPAVRRSQALDEEGLEGGVVRRRLAFPPYTKLEAGALLRWELRLPTGAPGIRHHGFGVIVTLRPDASVEVASRASDGRRVIARGTLNYGSVIWDADVDPPRGDARCSSCGRWYDARAFAYPNAPVCAPYDGEPCGVIQPVALDPERELTSAGLEMIEGSVEEMRRLFRARWLLAEGWADPTRHYEFMER